MSVNVKWHKETAPRVEHWVAGLSGDSPEERHETAKFYLGCLSRQIRDAYETDQPPGACDETTKPVTYWRVLSWGEPNGVTLVQLVIQPVSGPFRSVIRALTRMVGLRVVRHGRWRVTVINLVSCLGAR